MKYLESFFRKVCAQCVHCTCPLIGTATSAYSVLSARSSCSSDVLRRRCRFFVGAVCFIRDSRATPSAPSSSDEDEASSERSAHTRRQRRQAERHDTPIVPASSLLFCASLSRPRPVADVLVLASSRDAAPWSWLTAPSLAPRRRAHPLGDAWPEERGSKQEEISAGHSTHRVECACRLSPVGCFRLC